MCSQKKTAPGVTSTQGSTEIANFGERAFSNNYSNTDTGIIARILSHGRENAIPLQDLKAMTGMDGRTLRREIQRERLRGVPILSDNQSGYFLPASDQETKAFVRSMRSRSKEIQNVANSVEKGCANGKARSNDLL